MLKSKCSDKRGEFFRDICIRVEERFVEQERGGYGHVGIWVGAHMLM